MIQILLYRLMSNIKAFFNGGRITDDFDWEFYHHHYKGELPEIAKTHKQILSQNDYIFERNQLKLNQKILPLHPNHRLLYETILHLSPSSVMEIGCGGGDHLWNINILRPEIKLYGRDISIKMIKLLKKRHPDLNADIKQLDVTQPLPLDSTKVDIVFTQAVIMHIKTGNRHLEALANVFRYATKQIILMENWNYHNFMQSIELLFSQQMLAWDNIYMYYRDSKELGKPHIMVVSSEPLAMYKSKCSGGIASNLQQPTVNQGFDL